MSEEEIRAQLNEARPTPDRVHSSNSDERLRALMWRAVRSAVDPRVCSSQVCVGPVENLKAQWTFNEGAGEQVAGPAAMRPVIMIVNYFIPH